MDHLHRHGHARFHHALMPRESIYAPDAPTRVLLERTEVLTARSTSTCTNDTDDGCRKPTQISTLPIVLSAVIPIVCASVLLIFLHRRHVRKLKQEDAHDPHKSLDFGMDPAFGGKKKGNKAAPQMAMTGMDPEKSRANKGLSLEMPLASPYILPAGLHGSRESFHSMSRSMHDPDDPYGPVTFVKDSDSIRGGSSLRGYPSNDNSSTYTGSSGGTGKKGNGDGAGLLKNAQRMSQSFPPRGQSMSPERNRPPLPDIRIPGPTAAPRARSPLATGPDGGEFPFPSSLPIGNQPSSTTAVASRGNPGALAPANPLAFPTPPVQTITPPEPVLTNVQDTKVVSRKSPSPPPLPRIKSQEGVVQGSRDRESNMSGSSYGGGFKVTPPSPPRQPRPERSEQNTLSPPMERPNNARGPVGLGVEDLGYDPRRLSMSVRPLPSEDPNENPEERANRIRSFYKEYFDDSKPEPAGNHGGFMDYYEDYGSEYLDGTLFDPETGNFIVAQPQAPYAQPVTRRAMTPPPRAPPRFGRPGHMSNGSSASGRFPPRNMSSMSGHLPAPQARKPMPPPSPLASLPTPAKLTEDSMVFNAIDFAPPITFRDMQNGRRPESPLGAPRPFSPAVRPHTPLAGSFDDLAVLPSPHLLRKSGTFTALDFAPPPRFRDPGSNASDAGSIRSNRSGISQAGRMALRNGANRVSRLPKGTVGTRDDLVASLRPKLDMVSPA